MSSSPEQAPARVVNIDFEFAFLRNNATGTVHLVEMLPSWKNPGVRIGGRPDVGEIVVGLLMGDRRVRCGITVSIHRGGLEVGGGLLSTFEDDDLCARRHATLRGDREIEAAFSHPRPSDPPREGM